MKFRLTQKYWGDFANLDGDEKQAVLDSAETVQLALQGNSQWFSHHRIKRMQGHPGIWEGHIKSDLVFTFEKSETESGEKVCWIRRVGTHKIYDRP